ncbi:MAG: DUF4430 domain-containing protein [Bacilli bacterium]
MKAKIIKIVVSVLVLAAMIGIYCWAQTTPLITSGSVHIIVIDGEQHVMADDVWEFESTASNPITLHTILSNHYEIVVQHGMLVGINGLMANNTDYFWKIWINCEMANRGIDALLFKDGDEIRFVYTAVGDYYNYAC